MAKRVAKHIEVIRIHEHLKPIVKKLEGGFCVYEEGHSDDTVAAELGLSRSSVASIRRQVYGNVGAPPSARDEQRLAELTLLTSNLLTSYNDLRERHNKLVQTLTLNRVVDCKHLLSPA